MLADGRMLSERENFSPLVVIAEGEMDAAAWACTQPTDVAVLGIFSGSWTAAHATRIPDGARVLIATHCDRDGEKYARAIVETLEDRMRQGALTVERWR
jgi:hypothetical protein